MTRPTRTTRNIAAVAFALLVPSLAAAFSGGPPANRVHLCGQTDLTHGCNGCHATPGTTRSALTRTVTPAPALPAPNEYQPGTSYSILLHVVETATARCASTGATGCQVYPAGNCFFGFELAAVRTTGMPPSVCDGPSTLSCGATPVNAGCLTATQANTQIVCNMAPCPPCDPTAPSNNTRYVEHMCGILPDPPTNNEKSWTFGWQAPPPGFGDVTFYYANNSANGNGANTGDDPSFCSFTWKEHVTTSLPCDLLKASVPSLTPPIDKSGLLFSDTASCAPDAVPASVAVAMFTATPSQDLNGEPLASDATLPLIVYQVKCGCDPSNAKALSLVKTATGRIHATWQ